MTQELEHPSNAKGVKEHLQIIKFSSFLNFKSYLFCQGSQFVSPM